MSEQFVIDTEHFTGPLDLLLHLVTKRKLFINDISLASVADEYVERVRNMQDFPVAEVAQFIVIAATLLLIKSKSLLPALELTDEEQEDVASLERRLLQYQRMQAQARVIGSLFGSQSMYQRRESGDAQRPIEFTPSDDLTLLNLVNALNGVIATFPVPEKLPEKVVEQVMSLEEMIDNLRDRIKVGMEMSFKDFVGDKKSKVQMVVGFLAMLELVREGILDVHQQEAFADIQMTAQKSG